MRRRRALIALLAPLAAALVSAGCGYSLRTSMPPGITSIHVPVLENKTAEPGIEDFITQALTQAVVQSGRVRIAANAREADATVACIPVPVSEISNTTWRPGCRPGVLAAAAESIWLLLAPKSNFPPAGMASRALTHRFRKS